MPADRPRRRPSRRRSNSATRIALFAVLGLFVIAVVIGILVVLKRSGGIAGKGGGGTDATAKPPDGWEWHRGTGYEVLIPSRGERQNGLAILGDRVHPQVAARAELTTVTVEGLQVMWGRYPAPWGEYDLPPGHSAALLARMIERKRGRDEYVFELNRNPGRDFTYTQGRNEVHVRLVVVGDDVVLAVVSGWVLPASDPRVQLVRNSLTLR